MVDSLFRSTFAAALTAVALTALAPAAYAQADQVTADLRILDLAEGRHDVGIGELGGHAQGAASFRTDDGERIEGSRARLAIDATYVAPDRQRAPERLGQPVPESGVGAGG